MQGDPSDITGIGQYEKQIRLAPGAGNDILIIGDPGFIWYPLSVIVPFTTSATAGSRRIRMRIFDSAAIVQEDVEIFADYLQGSSETIIYIFAPGIESLVAPASGVNARVQVPIPSVPIEPGYQWEVDCFNRQAGDLFDDSSFTYRKYRGLF